MYMPSSYNFYSNFLTEFIQDKRTAFLIGSYWQNLAQLLQDPLLRLLWRAINVASLPAKQVLWGVPDIVTLNIICKIAKLIHLIEHYCEILWIIKYTPFLSAMIKLFILYCQSCLPACQFWQKVFTHGYIFRWHACCTKIEWKLKPERLRGPKANPKIIKLWGFRKIPESLDSRCNHLE